MFRIHFLSGRDVKNWITFLYITSRQHCQKVLKIKLYSSPHYKRIRDLNWRFSTLIYFVHTPYSNIFTNFALHTLGRLFAHNNILYSTIFSYLWRSRWTEKSTWMVPSTRDYTQHEAVYFFRVIVWTLEKNPFNQYAKNSIHLKCIKAFVKHTHTYYL